MTIGLNLLKYHGNALQQWRGGGGGETYFFYRLLMALYIFNKK